MKKIRILLADDHQLIITGLLNLFQDDDTIQVVGQANNGKALIQLAENTPADLVITDIEMPLMDGVEVATLLKKNNPDLKIIVLTMYNDKALTNQLLEIGVDGILYKNSDEKDFFTAIKKVMSGVKFYDTPFTTVHSLRRQKESKANTILTERELEIIKLVAQGNTNKEIGEKIFVSPRTVDTHRNNILKKLNLHNAVELTRYAFENNIL